MPGLDPRCFGLGIGRAGGRCYGGFGSLAFGHQIGHQIEGAARPADRRRGVGGNHEVGAAQGGGEALVAGPVDRDQHRDTGGIQIAGRSIEIDRRKCQRLFNQGRNFVGRNKGQIGIHPGRKVDLIEPEIIGPQRRHRHQANRRQQRKDRSGREHRGNRPRRHFVQHVPQMRAVLQHEGFADRARTIAQHRVDPAFRAGLAPHHGGIDPPHGAAIKAKHGQRQGILRHCSAPAGKDRPRHLAPRFGNIGRPAHIGIGDQRDRRCLDNIAVLNRAPTGNRTRIGRNRIGGEFNRAERQDEQSGAAPQRHARLFSQAQRSIKLAAGWQIEQRHIAPGGEHHHIARRGQPHARGDRQGLPPTQRAVGNLQARYDPGPAGPGHIGLPLADIVLIAGQVRPGQEAAIEITWAAAQTIKDQRSLFDLVFHILSRQHRAIRGDQLRNAHRIGHPDAGTLFGFVEENHQLLLLMVP